MAFGKTNDGWNSWEGSKQLCWDCRKATTGECNWSRILEPVEGWDAELIPLKQYRRDDK